MKPYAVPASFFGMVLGIVGLGSAWRDAVRLWHLPSAVAETIMFVGAAVWVVVLLLYGAKWNWARDQARAEFEHPIQCCFIGLAPISTLLMAAVVLPYSRGAALGLFFVGAVGQLAFGVYRTGRLWQGGGDPAAVTAVLYLPAVAGSFVTTIVAGALGFFELGRLFFGAGIFSWLALESIIVRRFYLEPPMPPLLRPGYGIQLAPPAVGAVAYLSITAGPADWFVEALLGYGLFQALVLARLVPWITRQPFAPSYWAFTFGVAATATAALRLVERGLDDTGFVALAAGLFVIANIVIVGVATGTVWLLVRGQLLPARPSLNAPRPSSHPQKGSVGVKTGA